MLEEIDLQADGDEKQRGEEIGDELVHDLPGLLPQVDRIADGEPGDEGPEDGMDMNALGEGGAEQAEAEAQGQHPARPGELGLDPGQDAVAEEAPDHQHEDAEGDDIDDGAADAAPTAVLGRPSRG